MQSRNDHLPLARATTGGFTLADAVSVGKLFEVATTIHAADYFQQQFIKQVAAMKLTDQFKDVLAEIDRFVSLVHDSSSTTSKYWSGEDRDRAMSTFLNYQQRLSEEAMAALTKSLAGQTINFDFDIDPNSMLLQGFSINGVVLDDEMNAQMNNIYSNWLTQNNMICKDGIIYEGNVDGTVKEGSDGKSKRADPQVYRDLFLGKKEGKQGFATFVKEKTKSALEVNVTDRSKSEPSAQQSKK